MAAEVAFEWTTSRTWGPLQVRRLTLVTMKLGIRFSILFLYAAFRLPAQTTPPVIRLEGIINLPAMKRVVLDIAQGSSGQAILLAEGQREGNIEVREIHAENGTV